jgi:FAD/FMN-containing dehydrogenase
MSDQLRREHRQRDRLLSELAGLLGPEHLLRDPALTAGYAQDWTGRWRGEPLAVARPATTAEVAAVLAACSRAGVPVVPQGGNTGLVGASAPRDGELVLSTRRLDRIEPADPAGRSLLAGAGATVSAVHAAAAAAGFDFPVDLGSRDSATVGGIVATNAGGERVIRHGGLRHHVLGLEAVLADGSVITRLSGLPKDNVGYDLPQLLVGSEGTLGVVTRVLWRLVPATPLRVVAMAGLGTVAEAVAVLAAARAALPALSAAEFLLADGLALVREHTGLPAPLREPAPVYLLLELADTGSGRARLAALEEELAGLLAGQPAVLDAVLGSGPADRGRLWRLREAHAEAIAAAARSGHPPVKLDVAVPLRELARFVELLPGALGPAVRPILFGHLAEGNVHVNLLGVAPEAVHAVTDTVLRLVAGLGGSISAEHGIGVAKLPWVGLGRGPADLAAMRAVKAALDPAGILSPGRLLPAAEGQG